MVSLPIRQAAAFFLLIGSMNVLILAGRPDDHLSEMLKLNPIRQAPPKLSSSADIRKAPSDIRAVLLGLVTIYQSYISTQDEDSCSFTVTCSAFSKEAIRKHGILKGILMTSDRLLRCHPLAQKYHPIDMKTRLAMDLPVEAYSLGRKHAR